MHLLRRPLACTGFVLLACDCGRVGYERAPVEAAVEAGRDAAADGSQDVIRDGPMDIDVASDGIDTDAAGDAIDHADVALDASDAMDARDAMPDGPVSDAADVADVTDVVDAPCTTLMQTISVSADADDGELEYGNFLPQGEPAMGGSTPGIFMGWWSSHRIWGYFRFQLPIALPATARIVSATLQLHGITTAGWNASTMALDVSFENSADAPAVTRATDDPDNPSGRALASMPTRWPASGGLAWSSGGSNVTPDLAAQLVEVIQSHGGLALGAHVQLWLGSNFTSTNAEVETSDVSHAPGTPAQLTITICR